MSSTCGWEGVGAGAACGRGQQCMRRLWWRREWGRAGTECGARRRGQRQIDKAGLAAVGKGGGSSLWRQPHSPTFKSHAADAWRPTDPNEPFTPSFTPSCPCAPRQRRPPPRYAIAMAFRSNQRVIYTSPLKVGGRVCRRPSAPHKMPRSLLQHGALRTASPTQRAHRGVSLLNDVLSSSAGAVPGSFDRAIRTVCAPAVPGSPECCPAA